MGFFAYLPVVMLVVTEVPAVVGGSGLQSTPTPTYEEFVQLPADRRDALFAQLGADTKAAFLRRRFESWLTEHRRQLSARQVAAVQDAIDLVTPTMYERPPDEGEKARQDAVGKKLYCSLGAELAYSFANGKAAPVKVNRTWSQAFESWAEWVVDCVM